MPFMPKSVSLRNKVHLSPSPPPPPPTGQVSRQAFTTTQSDRPLPPASPPPENALIHKGNIRAGSDSRLSDLIQVRFEVKAMPEQTVHSQILDCLSDRCGNNQAQNTSKEFLHPHALHAQVPAFPDKGRNR